MPTDARQEWPMRSYMHSWKLFRRMSDENEKTALHLLSRKHWPRDCDDAIILDVGCGDGLLVQRIVHLSEKPIAEVRLLDPDAEFLRQAEAHITETGIVACVTTHLAAAEVRFAAISPGAHVILAVHVGYLMQNGAFEAMLHQLPARIPLYVILDTPDSVFSALWERTAAKYWERSANVHRIVESLSPGQFEISHSTLTSCLSNPLEHKQVAIKEAVLSILCYKEVSKMSAEDRDWVEDVVKQHSVGDYVVCDSDCYEIVKL